MIQWLIGGTRRALGLHHPGRNLDVWPDDVFILSYPKSGNARTRFLIANLVYPETPADFSNINRLTPDPEALSKRALARMPRPRIIKSHQYFDPRYKRVIYVVRDPRDVPLSQYHFQRKRRLFDHQYPVEKFVTRLQKRLVKNGGRVVKHARDSWRLLAERHPNRRRSRAMLGRIALLPIPTG